MTTKDEWLALAGRLETATGPGQEINARLWLACGDVRMRFSKVDGKWAFFTPPFEDRRMASLSGVKGDEASAVREMSFYPLGPDYTRSLDAITALIERELSGAYSVQNDGGVWATAEVEHFSRKKTEAFYSSSGEGRTSALALCAAFCRAMAEKGA